MAYLETIKDEVKYVQVDGRLYGVKYQECCGKNNKPFVKFSVAFDYFYDEFGVIKNKYIPCIAWGDIAEIIDYLSQQQKIRIKVCGKIRENEYNGDKYETLECAWVDPLFEIPAQTQRVKRDHRDEFDEFDI